MPCCMQGMKVAPAPTEYRHARYRTIRRCIPLNPFAISFPPISGEVIHDEGSKGHTVTRQLPRRARGANKFKLAHIL